MSSRRSKSGTDELRAALALSFGLREIGTRGTHRRRRGLIEEWTGELRGTYSAGKICRAATAAFDGESLYDHGAVATLLQHIPKSEIINAPLAMERALYLIPLDLYLPAESDRGRYIWALPGTFENLPSLAFVGHLPTGVLLSGRLQ